MVLEMAQVLQLQRSPLALGMIAYDLLLGAELFRVRPIEVVVHHSRSTVIKRPFFVG